MENDLNNKAKHETALTSIKIFADKYKVFKNVSDGDFTLQKLVNRSLYLYINDPEYRKMIQNLTDLKTSGSAY
jgi:hypothetical protein